MTGKYPPNDEWNGAERKCKYCNEEMPCSVKYRDQMHGGKALMDNCLSTRGMFHSLACPTFLNAVDIESNRAKWVHNQNVWADEVARRKSIGLKYDAVEIKKNLVSQKKYYEMATFAKRSLDNKHPQEKMPGGPVPKPVIDKTTDEILSEISVKLDSIISLLAKSK